MVIVLICVGAILTVIGTFNTVFSVPDSLSKLSTTIGLFIIVIGVLIIKEQIQEKKSNDYKHKKDIYETLLASAYDAIKSLENGSSLNYNTLLLNIEKARSIANDENTRLLNDLYNLISFSLLANDIEKFRNKVSALEASLKRELNSNYIETLRH